MGSEWQPEDDIMEMRNKGRRSFARKRNVLGNKISQTYQDGLQGKCKGLEK